MMALALLILIPGTIASALAIGDSISTAMVVTGADVAVAGGLSVFAMIKAYIMEMFPPRSDPPGTASPSVPEKGRARIAISPRLATFENIVHS